jgi:3D (Asp-Asp-Asp) domain-containing protein
VIRALLFLLLTTAGAHEVAYPAPLPLDQFAGHSGRWVWAVVTAYSPLDSMTRNDEGNPRRLTATGRATGVFPYGVAADPARLPYGTRVIVPVEMGYMSETMPLEPHVVDDTGSIVKRLSKATGTLHLDVRYRTTWSARRFGVKEGWVFIIVKGGT